MKTTTPTDRYVSINETCRLYGISRSTFYRMLADPGSGLADVAVRIPPVTGRLRVPLRAFEQWLRRRRRRRRS